MSRQVRARGTCMPRYVSGVVSTQARLQGCKFGGTQLGVQIGENVWTYARMHLENLQLYHLGAVFPGFSQIKF